MSKEIRDLIDTLDERNQTQAELEQTVKLQREEIEKLRFTVKEQRMLIKDLQQQSENQINVPEDVNILKEMLISKKKELTKKEKDIEILEQKVNELSQSTNIPNTKAEFQSENEELIKARKMLVQLTHENEMHQQNENNAKKIIEKLRKENKAYQIKNKELKEQIRSLNNKLKGRKEVEVLKKQLEDEVIINEDLRTEIEDYKEIIEVLEGRIKELEESDHTAIRRLDEKIYVEKIEEGDDPIVLDIEPSNLSEEYQRLQRKIKTAELTHNRLVEEIERHIAEINNLEDEIKTKNIKIDTINAKNDSLNRKIINLEQEIENLTNLENLSRADDLLESFKTDNSLSELQSFKEENKRLKLKIENLEENYSEKVENFKIERDEFDEMIDFLRTENINLKEKVVNLENKQSKPNINFQLEQNSQDQFHAQIRDLNEKNEILRKDLAGLKDENTNLKHQIANVNKTHIEEYKTEAEKIRIDPSISKNYQNNVFLRIFNVLERNERELIIDSLIQDLMQLDNQDARKFIIELLSNIQREKVFDALINLIEKSDWITRLYLVKAFRKFVEEGYKSKFREPIKNLAQDKDPDVREAAQKVLRNLIL
ncbi:MAG: hypothetical protein GF353_08400 [Candidatus Lokiarchaeota archaeon]|nr:hypothetical protein [Candidatus Lokiarchaeota archaeon]